MKTNWILGIVVGSLAVCPLPAAEGITLRLVNSAKVPAATLLQGEKQAAHIFGKAGVALAWQDCSADPCDSPLGSTEFWLHVAAWKPEHAVAEALGFSVLPRDPAADELAGVYYPLVKIMAASYQVGEAEILGAALAHEIGHLLGVGHAPTGVMCRQFDRSHIVQASSGGLLFSTPQAAQIRAELTRRKASAKVP